MHTRTQSQVTFFKSASALGVVCMSCQNIYLETIENTRAETFTDDGQQNIPSENTFNKRA